MMLVGRFICLALVGLLLPLQAGANALVPSERWIASVAAPQPLLANRLGLVDLEGGGGGLAAELTAAARIALRKAGYFAAEGERVHVGIAVRSLGANGAEVEYTVRRGAAGQGGPVLYREAVKTATDNPSMTNEDTELRLLAGNLKLFVIGLRSRLDPGFAAATQLAAAAREEVDSRDMLSYIGEGAAKTLVATVEGTGAALGALGDVASSPEFHSALSGAASEYGRQQEDAAFRRAQLASVQAAAEREREARLAGERASARQRQAEQQAAQAERMAAQARQSRERQDAQAAAAAQRKLEADARLARQQAERDARAARQEAERAQRIARQEREARENAARQMRGFVASSGQARGSGLQMPDAGQARVGADPVPVAQKVSRGQARAWCRVTKGGEYWCNGPLQNGGWGTLKGALAMVDCPNGHGYTPTYGTGGQSFDCGRELKSTEQEMPLYDPFYQYGKSKP